VDPKGISPAAAAAAVAVAAAFAAAAVVVAATVLAWWWPIFWVPVALVQSLPRSRPSPPFRDRRCPNPVGQWL